MLSAVDSALSQMSAANEIFINESGEQISRRLNFELRVFFFSKVEENLFYSPEKLIVYVPRSWAVSSSMGIPLTLACHDKAFLYWVDRSCLTLLRHRLSVQNNTTLLEPYALQHTVSTAAYLWALVAWPVSISIYTCTISITPFRVTHINIRG